MVTECQRRILYFKEDIIDGRFCMSVCRGITNVTFKKILNTYTNSNILHHVTHQFHSHKLSVPPIPKHSLLHMFLPVLFFPNLWTMDVSLNSFLSHRCRNSVNATISPGILTRHLYPYPVSIYMFKVNNKDTKTRCETCSKLTIKTPDIFIVNFEHISQLVLKFLLLTLRR